MTLSFIFRTKGALVVVADRKAISKDDNIRDADSLSIKFFMDNITKIKEISHNLIFVGAGNKEILDKAIERINLSNDFEEFLKYLKIKINEIYSDFGEEKIDQEEFLVIEKDKQRAFKFRIKEIRESGGEKGCYELNSSKIGNNFIGCYENCINLGNVKQKIIDLRDKDFRRRNEEFRNKCNEFLSDLSIDNLNSVGHPSIHGSDIWLISKKKIKKFFTYPKNKYDYEIS